MTFKPSKPALPTPGTHLMRRALCGSLIASCVGAAIRIVAAANGNLAAQVDPMAPPAGCIVVPSLTNAVQLRLYTNASPTAPHLFNTFDIVAHEQTWLRSPAGEPLQHWLAESKPGVSFHNILVDGEGPILNPTNGMSIIEQASGPEWRYVALNATAAYRDRLQEYRRGVLFIPPDLFVFHDHLVARKPAQFQMLLHSPSATQLDAIWGDLRLDSTNGGIRIHTPSRRPETRMWSRAASVTGPTLAGTVAFQIGPSNKLATLDLVTVLAVYPAGAKTDYAFKLLESKTAIGARIHRDGLPTLVAFKTDSAATVSTLTGFGFTGPVGVDVFKPKRLKGK
jgi:hypothetical protein